MPFFEPSEWKALAVFRPREWLGGWRTEPLFSKIVVAVLAALGAYGLYQVWRGNGELGWFLVAAVAGLVVIVFALIPLLHLFVAAVRWMFRVTGIAAWWRKERKNVLALGKAVLWLAVAWWVLALARPYLSMDPVRSWYALTQQVPVERVEVSKKPHDCEFETAPLGSKHCHYNARLEIFNREGKRYLLVTYERVED